MGSLQEDLAARFRNKLTRSSLVTASRWAEQYRIMEGDFTGPWSFDAHPWLRGMHDSKHEFNIGQKAAQMGYSETMLNLAFFNLDILHRNVLYILPNARPDASDFSNRAINPAIEMSPHIKSMFVGGINNVGLRQVGQANMYIRGSNARSGLKSVPASVLIFDEFDEMEQKNIKLAEERSSGQSYRLNWKVSTPTVPNRGINTLFNRSTQDHFFFPCPHCSKRITLNFPDNIVITGDDPDNPEVMKTHLICNECKQVLEHKDKRNFLKKGEWVSKLPGQMMRGFYINQLFSNVLEPYKLAISFLEAKRDPTAEQEFFNSKMGLPHVVEGAQITEEMFLPLIKGYQMIDSCRPGPIVTMGIDVNKTFNVEIDQWDISESSPIDINQKARCKVLWAGEFQSIEEVGEAMTNYNVNFAVIDAMPETNISTQFCNNFYGRARMCRYNHYATARSVFAGAKDISLSVNRTAWLDQALSRFRNGTILLPSNLPQDYARQISALIRTPEKDSQGNLVYRYLHQDSRPDHYAHARNYAEMALLFATGNVVYKTIKEKV
jgi:hypothetical protein